MKRIIFHSYKGGSGKTVLAVNSALYLANQGKSVLLVECDLNMPSFTSIFHSIKPTSFLEDYFDSAEPLDNLIYKHEETNLNIVYSNNTFTVKSKLYSNDQAWFYEQLNRFKTDLQEMEYDYVLFDASPGFHLITINLIMISTSILLIMRPDFYSFEGTKILLTDVYKKVKSLNNTELHLIINQIPEYKDMDSLISKWELIFETNFPYLDKIIKFPYSSAISYYSAVNQLLLPKNSSFYQELVSVLG